MPVTRSRRENYYDKLTEINKRATFDILTLRYCSLLNCNNMKEVITLKTIDNSTFTIFTKYITHIQHAPDGCIIHISGGDHKAGIATAFNWAEMVNILALK